MFRMIRDKSIIINFFRSQSFINELFDHYIILIYFKFRAKCYEN